MQLLFDLPPLSATEPEKRTSKEIQEIKNYLVRLTEQLKFVLSNLESDNFSGNFTDGVKELVASNTAAVKASQDRLSGEVAAALGKLPAIAFGSCTLSPGADTSISFSFSGPPAVFACYAGQAAADCPITVHNVTASGAKLKAPSGAPSARTAYWAAIYKNQ